MKKQGKLELTWVGKYEEKKVEPRILVEDKAKSYGDPSSENMLIHGDNLIALKALEQDYSGKVKCVYIDPPYNTGSAFEHYDDNLEHSIWLNMIKQRIEIIRNLLSDDGFLCCHIDDSEGHYLKILLDEIFGRSNYLTTLYIRVRYPDKTLKSDMDFHKEIEQILVYRKQFGATPNLHEKATSFDKFTYYFEEIGSGESIELGGKKVEIFKKGTYKLVKNDPSEFGLKEIWATGTILDGNSSGRFFRDFLTGRYEADGYGTMYKVYGIGDDRYDYRYFTGPNKPGATKGKYFQGVPMDKLEATESTTKTPINGFYDLAGSFGNCRQEGGVGFRGGKKPEILLEMILRYFSNENDIVLDSFLGSGTTAAVAHKMNRRWIGIEMGEHCYSLCMERLRGIVDGTDRTGITETASWKGGGGFKFFELADSLLVRNSKLPVYQINPSYTFEMITEAICKLEGFKYSPTGEYHGFSTENRFIHITNEFVNSSYVVSISKHLSKNQSLLIYCTKKQSGIILPENIEIKRIPKDLLSKCDFESEEM